MKATGQIDPAFDTGLVVCLTDDIEDGGLQISFEELLSLTVGSRMSPFFIAFGQSDKEEHSIDNLFNFLTVILIRLLKPSFLKQHKTDLEQYPLAPTSTAKSSTHQPLDSMIIFKANYLLILVPCLDSIFSSQGHVGSMRITFLKITFLKLFEKTVMSGLRWVRATSTEKQ